MTMKKIIFVILTLGFCINAKAQPVKDYNSESLFSKHTGLNTPIEKSFLQQKELCAIKESLSKKKEKRTTLYIGLGIASIFPSESFSQKYLAPFLSSANLDIGFSRFFHLNTGIDAAAAYSSNDVTMMISAIPEFSVSDENFIVLFGFGAFTVIAFGKNGGMASGFLPSFKFNYFISKNIGIGLELKHPTTFSETHFYLMSTLGVNFKL